MKTLYKKQYRLWRVARWKKDNEINYIGKKEYARANAFHLDWTYEYEES